MQIKPPSHTTTEPPQHAARLENAPTNLPRKTHVRASALPRFCDAAHWDELAAQHLPRYDLPAWDVPCSLDAMETWLYRLNLTEKEYRALTNTGLADFCTLNPAWPLRAWIGTALELDHERRGFE